jgi:hypothetical protein
MERYLKWYYPFYGQIVSWIGLECRGLFLLSRRFASFPRPLMPIVREELEVEANFYQIGSLIKALNEEKESLKVVRKIELKSNGYYCFGFASDGTVDEKRCEIFNKATKGSSAPFIFKFDINSDKVLPI